MEKNPMYWWLKEWKCEGKAHHLFHSDCFRDYLFVFQFVWRLHGSRVIEMGWVYKSAIVFSWFFFVLFFFWYSMIFWWPSSSNGSNSDGLRSLPLPPTERKSVYAFFLEFWLVYYYCLLKNLFRLFLNMSLVYCV